MQYKIKNLKEYISISVFLHHVVIKEKAFAASPFLGTFIHLNKFCSFEIMSTSNITTFERRKRKGREKQAED